MSNVLIIAEMGVNHNGSLETAKKLISSAARAGVDAVKSQHFHSSLLVTVKAQTAAYQRHAVSEAQTQAQMLHKLELSCEDYLHLQSFAQKEGVLFFSTPFDLQSIRELKEMGVPLFKIPSGEITNLPYLIEIGKSGKPAILSTGMSTLSEINDAIEVLQAHGTKEISLLHCNTQYPTPFEDANLLAIRTLRQEFALPVGYSDHTPGIEASIAAVALGAEIIEKHVTLSRTMDGPDHNASIEPSELADMVRAIRNIEKALGDGVKRLMESEQPNITVVRKSIVAAQDIKKGDIFTEENITTKRPGNGISPMEWFNLLGKCASRNFIKDELIEL